MTSSEVECDPNDENHLIISRNTDVPMIDMQSSEGEAAPDDEDFVPAKKPPAPRKKKEKDVQKTADAEENKQGEYFWDITLHYEFMRHFSVYGKTWKVVSAKMSENGIKNKDQLQCRTHGQKYLIGLGEIVNSIGEPSKSQQ